MGRRNISLVVEKMLRDNPILRDSDKRLLMEVWEMEGLFLSETQKTRFLQFCTTPETITRARREAVKKYPASHSTTEERYKKFNDYRKGEIY